VPALRRLGAVPVTVVMAVLVGATASAGLAAMPAVPGSGALYADVAAVTAGLTSDTLQAPTALAAAGGASATLSWTPTVDSYADGYRVYRATSSGGPYTEVGTATPAMATGYLDLPGADATYWYVVRTFASNWLSVPSRPVSATVATVATASTGFRDCSAQAADSGGDGNGYQGNPAYACAVDGLVATDVNSGSGTSTLCTATTKDRHRFSAFGLGVPATAAAVLGITIDVNLGIDRVSGTNRVCAQLSWDGGSSWTTTQSVTITSTALTEYTLGGPALLWGRVWTPTELSDANFRVRLINVSSNNARDFFLDAVEVQVNYTP